MAMMLAVIDKGSIAPCQPDKMVGRKFRIVTIAPALYHRVQVLLMWDQARWTHLGAASGRLHKEDGNTLHEDTDVLDPAMNETIFLAKAA
jgi:hypothetical protein